MASLLPVNLIGEAAWACLGFLGDNESLPLLPDLFLGYTFSF